MIAPLLAFAAFVALAVPIGFALGGGAAIGLWLMEGVPLDIVASRTFGAMDSFTFLAIPFFILAGELMETGGISRRLIVFASAMVGHIKGGLGNVVVLAMMLFSGISGSTNADAAAVGSVMIPSMKERGYSGARAGAVVAAVYAMLAGGLLYREITLAFFWRALVRTGVTTGAVMLMVAGANILAWLMTVEQVPQSLAQLIASVGGGKLGFMLFSIVVFLVIFALLDGIPGMLMLVPVFVPIARELGIDLLHYGIVMTSVMGIALFMPPIGVGLYIVLGMAGASLGDISRHLLPYLGTMLLVTLLIAFIPALVFLLPDLLGLHGQ